jgi:hypothetical protein
LEQAFIYYRNMGAYGPGLRVLSDTGRKQNESMVYFVQGRRQEKNIGVKQCTLSLHGISMA